MFDLKITDETQKICAITTFARKTFSIFVALYN